MTINYKLSINTHILRHSGVNSFLLLKQFSGSKTSKFQVSKKYAQLFF